MFLRLAVGFAAALVVLANFSGSASAQEFLDFPASRDRTTEPPATTDTQPAVPAQQPAPAKQPNQKPGSFGSFNFDPQLTFSQEYDDNIFSTRNNKIGDAISIVSPSLRVESDWTKHQLNLFSGADIGRYAGHGSENYEDYWFGGDGRLDLTGSAALFGGAQYSHNHEERDSPDGVAGTRPTIYHELFGYAGGEGQFGPVSLRVGGTYKGLNYNDVNSTTGIINNDDRDRTLYEIGGRLGYTVASGYEVFLQGASDIRRYDAARDDAGFDRDSNGFNLALGFKVRVDRNLRLEVLGGYMRQNYDDRNLKDVGVPDFGGRLTYQVTPRTSVTALLDRTVEETTAVGASSYIATTFGAQVEHKLAPDMTVNGSIYYTIDDYVGINREDDLVDAGLGLRYYVTPNLWFGPDYRFLQRNSDAAGEDYDENRFFLRFGAALTPEYSDADMVAYNSGIGALPGLKGLYTTKVIGTCSASSDTP